MVSRPCSTPLVLVLALLLAGCGGGSGTTGVSPTSGALANFLIMRGASLELPSVYVPPPGDPLEHHASGYAKVMCSGVFITGLDPAVVADAVGYVTAPFEERAKMNTPVVDRVRQEVRVSIPNGPTLTARYLGSQGCLTLPAGVAAPFFTPVQITPNLPDAATTAWPMGDLLPTTPPPSNIDMARVQQAVDAAFDTPSAYTSAFVVTYKGRLIGERYMPGITTGTPLESWSLGKSVLGTLVGQLIQQGAYTLDQLAPIPEWQGAGDGRRQIRISDLLRMSSGIRINSQFDPDYNPNGTYPDNLYLYTGRINSFSFAATRPQQWAPGLVGRYRATDSVLASYLVRLAVEKRGEQYLSFPQRQLFDKLGIRSMVMETDPYGNFLTHGYEYMSARDWARLGNLYLQDGVWNGERLLPVGYTDFVRTPAPAWVADARPIYGATFWLNAGGNIATSVPASTYCMLGAGGQYVCIVPSHDLVVVRIGHSKGEPQAKASLERALGRLMVGVPGN